MRNGGNNGNNGNGGRKLDLPTDIEGRRTPQAQSGGSSHMQQQQYQQQQESRTPSSRGSWDQKDRMLGNRTSNSNLQYGYQHGGKGESGSGVPNVPPIPQQYLQQPRMTAGSSFAQGGGVQQQGSGSGQASGQALIPTPIDVPSLIATKGYNPANFDTRPQFVRQQNCRVSINTLTNHSFLVLQARFFVIKSYTEDDVHKSLKYEIWSSTDPGNKRLDKAFKENAGRGPIYLFFSVNARCVICFSPSWVRPYTASVVTSVGWRRC